MVGWCSHQEKCGWHTHNAAAFPFFLAAYRFLIKFIKYCKSVLWLCMSGVIFLTLYQFVFWYVLVNLYNLYIPIWDLIGKTIHNKLCWNTWHKLDANTGLSICLGIIVIYISTSKWQASGLQLVCLKYMHHVCTIQSKLLVWYYSLILTQGPSVWQKCRSNLNTKCLYRHK